MNPEVESDLVLPGGRLWAPEREAVFVEALAKQPQFNGVYAAPAWIAVANVMNARCKFARPVTDAMMVNKYYELQSRCKIYSDLVRTQGFVYDEKTQVISADDEKWNKYLRAYPNGNILHKAPLTHCDLLKKIYPNILPNRGVNDDTIVVDDSRATRRRATSQRKTTEDGQEKTKAKANTTKSTDDDGKAKAKSTDHDDGNGKAKVKSTDDDGKDKAKARATKTKAHPRQKGHSTSFTESSPTKPAYTKGHRRTTTASKPKPRPSGIRFAMPSASATAQGNSNAHSSPHSSAPSSPISEVSPTSIPADYYDGYFELHSPHRTPTRGNASLPGAPVSNARHPVRPPTPAATFVPGTAERDAERRAGGDTVWSAGQGQSLHGAAAWGGAMPGAAWTTHPTKSEQAIKYLEKEYGDIFDRDDMVSAMEAMEDEVKAAIFLCMEEGEVRDTWLTRQIRRVDMLGGC
ncbi:hypothetical protein GP486_005795 [Trichoglossum hirsutum]|uniref:Myb/SANT-like domain-containing protein n=1 Tax=Trichoglossum hirsutum TaxID=265104 RepID=A0A9P8L8H3_9PEZI|nr:hypothetical protein GP486_005795 [Trichoglossum hirsutum]